MPRLIIEAVPAAKLHDNFSSVNLVLSVSSEETGEPMSGLTNEHLFLSLEEGSNSYIIAATTERLVNDGKSGTKSGVYDIKVSSLFATPPTFKAGLYTFGINAIKGTKGVGGVVKIYRGQTVVNFTLK